MMIPGILAQRQAGGGGGGVSGPTWLSTTGSFTTSQTSSLIPVAMPSAVDAGDLLIMVVTLGDAWTDYVTPSGWTVLRALVTNGIGSQILYKIATGSEGGTTVNAGRAEGAWKAAQVIRIKAGTFNATTPVASASAATGSSSQPNSGSLSPAWGSADTLWISIACGNMVFGMPNITTPPYTQGATMTRNTTSSGSTVPYVASCSQVISGATQDSPAWALSVNTFSWIADTLAVQPA